MTEVDPAKMAELQQQKLPLVQGGVQGRVPKVFPEEKLREQYKAVRWQRRVNVHQSLLLQHRKLLEPFFNPVEKQVYQKVDRLFQKNKCVARTTHDQFMQCFETMWQRIEALLQNPGEETKTLRSLFPEEKQQLFWEIFDEARQLSALMEIEAQAMRSEVESGNLKYVEKFT